MRIFKFKFQLNYLSMLLSFLICFAGSSAYAQANKNKVEGEIVMSKAELESLLTKIAEKRKESLKNNKVIQTPIYTQPRVLTYQNPRMYQDFRSEQANQDQKLYQDLSNVEYKLDLLLSRANILPSNGSNTTYILPSQVQGKSSQPVIPIANNNLAPPPSKIVNMSEGGREILKSHQVFFANNSTMVSANDKRIIQELTPTIKERQNEILVVLKGFASKVGKAFYNNQLSYNRADAIKQILVSSGVNPSNIMILYHGSDSTLSADEARRVEISLELIPSN